MCRFARVAEDLPERPRGQPVGYDAATHPLELPLTIRAVILGLMLAIGIACTTWFNTWVIESTPLIGNLLPIGVFGVIVLVMMLVNPALRAAGKGLALKPSEIAIVCALALAICGWPDSGFFRTFIGTTAMPGQLLKQKAAWRAQHVMSYVPGGSPQFSSGQVRDWPAFARRLLEAGEGQTVEALLWQRMKAVDVRVVSAAQRASASEFAAADDLNRLLGALNEVIAPASGVEAAADTLFYRLAPESSWTPRVEQVLARREAWLAALPAMEAEIEQHQQLLDAAKQRVGDELAAAADREAQLQAQVKDIKSRYDTLWLQRDKLRAAGEAVGELTGQIDTLQAELTAAEAKLAQVQRERAVLQRQLTVHERDIDVLERGIELRRRQARKLEFVANRAIIDSTFDQLVAPYPRGEGVLVLGGRADPDVVEILAFGWGDRYDVRHPSDTAWALQTIPWAAWWPTLRLWGGVGILVGLGSLCLAMIVHPQWSRRELLTYPIARFVHELTDTDADGRTTIFRSRLFWIAFAAVMVLHLVNGLHKWYPGGFEIPTQPDFNPLKQLFPYAAKAPGSWLIFRPTMYLVVIAFAFFLSAEVSFSLGISAFLWMFFCAILIRGGVPIQDNYATADMGPMMRFGAYIGLLLMVLYTGRRYYLNVIASTVGLPRQKDTPTYAVWSARLLVLCMAGTIYMLVRYGGIDWPLATLGVFLVMLTMLIVARVNAETGLLIMQPVWMPISVIAAFFGMEGVGPTGFIVIAMLSVVAVGDPREAIMPYLSNCLRISEETANEKPSRVVWPIGLVVVAGFVLAAVVTLAMQYNLGNSSRDSWAHRALPSIVFDQMAKGVQELDTTAALSAAADHTGMQMCTQGQMAGEAASWAAFGLALVLGCAVARLRIPWWPLHPVAFLIWSSYFGMRFAPAFMVGWAIKAATVKLAGAKGYRSVRPFMIGVIAGELLGALFWIVVNALYYVYTGKSPPQYSIMPH